MAFLALDSLSLQASYKLLNPVKSFYPVIIAVVFLLCFIIFGVVNSPSNDGKVTIHSMKGPGGRPLPVRRKSNNQIKESVETRDFSGKSKAFFAILTGCLVVAFGLNGAALMIQAVSFRDDHWWAGQSAVVSIFSTISFFTDLIRSLLLVHSSLGE